METTKKMGWFFGVGAAVLSLAVFPGLSVGAFMKTQTLGTTTESNSGTLAGRIATITIPLQTDDDLQQAYNAGKATITLTAGMAFTDPFSRTGRLCDAQSSLVFHGVNDGSPWPENDNDHNFLAPGGDYLPSPNSATYDMKFLGTYTGYRTLEEINVFHGFNGGRDPYNFDILYSTTAAPTVFNLIVSVQNPDMNNNVLIRTILESGEVQDVDTIRFVIRSTEIPGAGYFANAFQEIDINFVPEPATIGLLAIGGLLLRRKG